jgi:arylsulfatase
LTADIDVPDGGVEGVIIARGGRYGGYSLYVKDGKLIYEANTFGTTHEKLVSSQRLPKGKVHIAYDFTVDRSLSESVKGLLSAALLAKSRPGTGVLSVNGVEVARAHLSQFGGFRSAITETFDLGKDTGSPVSQSYESPFAFTGKVEKVEVELKP